MPEAIIITPVKDSLDTTKLTIEAISKTKGNFEYFVYNDFSQPQTKIYLDNNLVKDLTPISEINSIILRQKNRS